MADVETQDQVHKDGTDHIKDKVFGEGEGTTPKPEPIVAAKPPASNPGADDPSAGIAKDAGGLSASAHVGSPTTGNKEKRKSIVGQLKGLFLGGGDKKEREASEAGTAKHGATTTGAIAAGAAGTGTDTGKAVALPDRTKSATTEDTAPKSTTEQVKEAVTGDTQANTDAVAASTTEPTTTTTETAPQTTESKPEISEPKTEERTDTSGNTAHKPPAPAGGKTPENREAIPTAGGERLGDKHWGESKIVPDNPKAAQEKKDEKGVASSEGQPTAEVKDNTAKNTGGASGGPKSETPAGDAKEKGKFMDKVKDKLPFGKKDKA